ncbi:hypothetical protein BDF21DRAFT_403018 [Thamnidium elegans]|nr:hypothetical protein BDF21DRAFT_403018 [Thamnidium elegans]
MNNYKSDPVEKKNSASFSDVNSIAGSEVSSLVAKLEQLSINLVKLNEGVIQQQRQAVTRPQYNNNPVPSGPRVFTCFYCRDEGHKKYDCPKFLRDQGQAPSPATGSNNIPIEIKLVEVVTNAANSVIPNEVFANGVKRRAVVSPSIEAVSGSAVPVIVKRKVEVKKKPRQNARRFPVKLKRSKIWSRLLSTESGLSVAEWLSLDKEAASEVIDGIRFLKESRIKKASANLTAGKTTGVGVPVIPGAVFNPGFGASSSNGIDPNVNAGDMMVNKVMVDSEESSVESDSEVDSDSENVRELSSFSGRISMIP